MSVCVHSHMDKHDLKGICKGRLFFISIKYIRLTKLKLGYYLKWIGNPTCLIVCKSTVLCIFVIPVFLVFKSSYSTASKILRLSDIKMKIAKAHAINHVSDLHRLWCEPFCRLYCSLCNSSQSQGYSRDKSLRLLFLNEQVHTLITFKIYVSSMADVWQKALNSEHIVTGLNK